MAKSGGREKGTPNKKSQASILAAKATGLLPHEWLLLVSRGEPIPHKKYVDIIDPVTGKVIGSEIVEELFCPSFDTRVEAAKHAAPYYAAKVCVQTINHVSEHSQMLEAIAMMAGKVKV